MFEMSAGLDSDVINTRNEFEFEHNCRRFLGVLKILFEYFELLNVF